jgi:hypothetical protein
LFGRAGFFAPSQPPVAPYLLKGGSDMVAVPGKTVGPPAPEEVLVADARARLTPAEMVGRKLLGLLRGAPVADSQVRAGGPLARGRKGGPDA